MKISQTHHVTRKGTVKKNPLRKEYTEKDFTITTNTGDSRILYHIESKDQKIDGNFFFEPNNVHMRFITPNDAQEIFYPFANKGGGATPPQPEVIVRSLVNRLNSAGITK